MTNSMKNRLLSMSGTVNEISLNEIRKEFMMEQHRQTCTRNLLADNEEEQDLRQELRREKETEQSPRSIFETIRGGNEIIAQKLHGARDERTLKLPSLAERKSQDYSQQLKPQAIGPTSE